MKTVFDTTIFSGLSTLLGVMLMGTTFLTGQDIKFTANGPKVASTGERFRIVYTVNAQGTGLETGDFEGFSLLSGPNASTSTSMRVFNGKMEQSIEVSYTYILQATRVGKFSIPAAAITVEGKKYRSNPLVIEVIKGQNTARANPNSGQGRNPAATNPANAISDDDIFLRMLVSKKEAYQGEPVIATLKLYTKVNLADLGNFKRPTFNGFWSESLQEAQQLSFQRENVNGQIYNTAVIQQHVLIPERSGVLNIEPAELTALIQVQVRNRRSRSLLDQFFGGHQNVEQSLSSGVIKLKVKPLPAGSPADFSGAVGNINLAASLEPAETKTNEPVTLRITYSGTGNLKLVPEPKLNFPSDFEVYDPKVTSNYSASARGFSGSKTYEYLLIPRHEGDFEIPAIAFSVFDLESKSYKSTAAGPFPVHVEKGEGGEVVTGIDLGMVKEDVRELGSDIRYIRTDDFGLRHKGRPFFGSPTFYLSYAFSMGLFAMTLLLVRQRRKRTEDVVYMKNKKAGRIAQTRLKKARTYLEQREQTAFYKEVLNAQWGYLSDKLNIPQGELNKGKIRDSLASRQVEATLIDEFIKLMDRCEFAQFAPGSTEEELSGIYDESARLFTKLENAFK